MKRILAFGFAACLVGVPAFSDTGIASRIGLDGFITVERLPVPEDPVLIEGRQIWGDTCQNCHGGNKATGAPKITSTKAWDKRVQKGLPVLIEHAINGFVGPRYTEMPPRGANPDLSDEEVAAAVLFMVWSSDGAGAVLEYLKTMKRTGK